MAGSLKHILDDDGNYRGTSLLENMRDMHEAVEEMAFVLIALQQNDMTRHLVSGLIEDYYACCRKEKAWPAFMNFDSTTTKGISRG